MLPHVWILENKWEVKSNFWNEHICIQGAAAFASTSTYKFHPVLSPVIENAFINIRIGQCRISIFSIRADTHIHAHVEMKYPINIKHNLLVDEIDFHCFSVQRRIQLYTRIHFCFYMCIINPIESILMFTWTHQSHFIRGIFCCFIRFWFSGDVTSV